MRKTLCQKEEFMHNDKCTSTENIPILCKMYTSVVHTIKHISYFTCSMYAIYVQL